MTKMQYSSKFLKRLSRMLAVTVVVIYSPPSVAQGPLTHEIP